VPKYIFSSHSVVSWYGVLWYTARSQGPGLSTLSMNSEGGIPAQMTAQMQSTWPPHPGLLSLKYRRPLFQEGLLAFDVILTVPHQAPQALDAFKGFRTHWQGIRQDMDLFLDNCDAQG